MKNKLTSPRQIYYRHGEWDTEVCACIISSALINETLSVMYNMVKKTQLFASVGECIGTVHLSLRTLNKPSTTKLHHSERRWLKTIIHG